MSGAHFAFTDRWGGVSAVPYEELNLGGAVGDDPDAVRANRELAAKSLGLDPGRVVWMNQVHGADVAEVDGPWTTRPDPAGGRGWSPPRRGLALAVLTADCVPVLLADPVAGVVAAAHAGRPGMVAGDRPRRGRRDGRRSAPTPPGSSPAPDPPSAAGATRCRRRCAPRSPPSNRPRTPRPAGAPRRSTWPPACTRSSTGSGCATGQQSPVCTRESEDHFSYRRDRTTGRLAGYVWLD